MGLAMRSESPARPGDLVDGKYRIQHVLGVGAMGVVVRAFHEELQRPVAIKFLLTPLIDNPAVVQRFEREARATLRLKSEHIIEVLDVASLPSGEPFIVMEFLEGSDLSKHLADGRQLPVDEAIDLIDQLCAGVAEAHAAGVVHRDIKPGNIYLAARRDGRRLVKILDFGISKVDDHQGAALTGTKDVLGSPHYMSPEQLVRSRDAGPACDVWALGVVLYLMLTGVRPFDGETLAAIIVRVIGEQHVPVMQCRSDVPPWLSAIVDHCLQKDVADRMPSAVAMRTALHAHDAHGAHDAHDAHAATMLDLSGAHPAHAAQAAMRAQDTERPRRGVPAEPAGTSRGSYVALGVGAVLVLGGAYAVHRFAPRPSDTEGTPHAPLSSSATPSAAPSAEPVLTPTESSTPSAAAIPSAPLALPPHGPKPRRNPAGLPGMRK